MYSNLHQACKFFEAQLYLLVIVFLLKCVIVSLIDSLEGFEHLLKCVQNLLISPSLFN